MSSFPETKVEKWISPNNCQFFIKYHEIQFSRVYPKGARIDSSNYDPVRMWNCGCQMVALNYQTPDRPMQLNQGKFLQNGRCGYVLRPSFMFDEKYNPYNRSSLCNIDPVSLSIRVIAARHLMKSGRGIVSPFVEVEVVGSDLEPNKYKTGIIRDNGLNPIWNESFDFYLSNPALSLLRFVVQDEDMFGDPNFLGQATYPVTCLRSGYRSVLLKNEFSEELELASLLIHLNIHNAKDEEDLYASIQQLRDRSKELNGKIEEFEKIGDEVAIQRIRAELTATEEQLLCKNEERRQRIASRLASHN